MTPAIAPFVSRLFYTALRVCAGLIALLGALFLGNLLPVAYLLFTGQLAAGDRLPFDEVTPSVREAVVQLLVFFSVTVAGSVLGVWAGKQHRREP